MKIFSKSDIGKVRTANQDSFFAVELENNAAFGIVCDGMGGANAGNVASETAVKIISDYILRSYRTEMNEFDIEKMIKNAVESANIEIFDMSNSSSDLNGMGTTAVIALIKNNKAVIANIGDSRVYLVDENISQLTRDHSIVQSLIESGEITPEDAKVHPRKNIITRALGVEESIVADTSLIDIKSGQTLLLCSDGLSSYSDTDDILKVFKQKKAEDVCNELVNLAVSGGGGDNITVITIFC